MEKESQIFILAFFDYLVRLWAKESVLNDLCQQLYYINFFTIDVYYYFFYHFSYHLFPLLRRYSHFILHTLLFLFCFHLLLPCIFFWILYIIFTLFHHILLLFVNKKIFINYLRNHTTRGAIEHIFYKKQTFL